MSAQKHDGRDFAVDEVLLQPWFLDVKQAAAVRRVVPDHFLQKMRFYFADWGCLICGSKRRRYGSNGMCHVCVGRIHKRLLGCLSKRGIEAHRKAAQAPTRLREEIERVRNARMLLSEFVDNLWSPNPMRLSSSVRRTRTKSSPRHVR